MNCFVKKKMATSQDMELEYEFVEELPQDLTCSICMKVLCEPHLMNCCEQQFCKRCLEKWWKKNQSCPHCRSTDFEKVLLKQKSRRIGNLKVYCPNKKHGCDSILKITECDNHLSTANAEGCLYIEVSCPNKCKIKVFRGDLKDHTEKQCCRRQVACQYCRLRGEHQVILGKHLCMCPSIALFCPLKCGATVQRKDLETHRDACPLEIVPCPYSELGCKVKVCRKDLEKHVESSALQHMTELAKSHLSLKAEHAALKAENTALKKHLTEVDAKFYAMGKMMPKRSDSGDNDKIYDYFAKISPLLVDTSIMTLGTPLTLRLSQANVKSGYHYLKVSDYKFRLEWEEVQNDKSKPQDRETQIKLFLVRDGPYAALPDTWKYCIETIPSWFGREQIVISSDKSRSVKGTEEASNDPSLQLLAKGNYYSIHVFKLSIVFRR